MVHRDTTKILSKPDGIGSGNPNAITDQIWAAHYNSWINDVRFWLKADIPSYVDLCPLSGVKRTQIEWVRYVRF